MDKTSARMDKAASRSVATKPMLMMALLGVLVACVVTGGSAASVTSQCPTKADPSMAELFYYSDVVVLGKVLQQFRATPEAPSFTAELEVYCVFKGKDLPRTMNVSNAGKVDGQCFETAFTVGNSYLVYLRKEEGGNRLIPAFKHHPDTYKDEIYSMCNVNISYPIGLSQDQAEVSCEDDYEGDYDYDYPEEEGYEYGPTDCIPPFDPTTASSDESNDSNSNNNAGSEKETEVTNTSNSITNEGNEGSGGDVSYTGGNDITDNTDQGGEVPDTGTNDIEDNDDNNLDKEVPYQPGRPGKVEVDSSVDGENGSAPLRMSVILLALLNCIVLMFS